MIKIGYCPSGGEMDFQSILTAHPAFHPSREDIPVQGKARRCPSFNEYVMSAFNIGIGFDARFRVRMSADKQYFVEFDPSHTTLPEEALGHAFSLEDFDDGIIQLGLFPHWIFISDDPNVLMTVQSAQKQTNPQPIRGQLDIYNWIRPTSYAFTAEVDQWVTLSKDSPIFQVKFYHPTENHFVVAECMKTPEIVKREQYRQLFSVTGSLSLRNWKQIWAFNGRRRPKTLLEFIE